MKMLLLVLALTMGALALDPPSFNYAFRVNFDEGWIVNKTNFRVNGQFQYDPANNRERIDRTNGRYDIICGTITPNQTTPCQQITVDNTRWVIFPQKATCCACCDAQHGCGILRPDWLHDAKYLGQEKITDTIYDKWSKDSDSGYNYYWTTTDQSKTPRRLDENGTHYTDFNTHSFINQTVPFPDSTFALPSYCVEGNLCPKDSACGLFRSEGKRLASQ